MKITRSIQTILQSRPTIEGAGVHLKRVFGYPELSQFDPFLLLDEFHSSNPADYIAGFPWHPHRGIETITYMLYGEVKHEDSLGNGGIIHPGDVQWMTAGSGIIHSEMPVPQQEELWGFQLWANLPASHKMMPPRYREITHPQIPLLNYQEGVSIRVLAGQVQNTIGPVQDIITDPLYLDITIQPDTQFTLSVPKSHTVFSYVVTGAGYFSSNSDSLIEPEHLVLFSLGDSLELSTAKTPLRCLVVAGQPIGEPIAWRGPIVMNTQNELTQAFNELQAGTFLKHS